MKKKTLVFGASLKPNRYSNIAIKRLTDNNIDVVAFGLRSGEVHGVTIETVMLSYKDLHTVTIYMNAKNQIQYYDHIVSLNAQRVLFNPGTENPEFYRILDANNIAYEEACTLALLLMNQY